MSFSAARKLTPWSPNFVIVDQLLEAPSNAVRAGILLRLSDAAIAADAQQLQEACGELGFAPGRDYVAVRLAQHCQTRDAAGNLPADTAAQLEYWRLGMLALSGAGQ